jgi:hypothetical protein
MEKLQLNQIIQISLGEIGYNGMEISLSKELAYLEIQKRTIEYREENNVAFLVENLNLMIRELKSLDILFPTCLKIKIVNTSMLYSQFYDLMNYSIDRFHPNKNLLVEYNSLVTKLLDIWENDPEHIRHSSKFNERRPSISSQEYFSPIFFDYITTASAKFTFESTANLGFDYLRGIINHCIDSDICVIPVRIKDGYDLVHILNFVVLFNVQKCPNSLIWFVFFQEPETTNESIDIYINDMRAFFYKLTRFSGFTFDLMTYSILKKNEIKEWDYDELLSDLDSYAKQHQIRKQTCESRLRIASIGHFRYI